MTPAGVNGQRWRGVQASECSQTPSPTSMGKPLITSPAAVNSSPFASPTMGSTKRFSSGSPVFGASLRLSRDRSSSSRQSISTTATFAPRFISYEPDGRDEKERVKSMAGDIDLSGGKRYVWVKDAATAFVRGWVVEELDERNLLVQCDDGTVGDQQQRKPSTRR